MTKSRSEVGALSIRIHHDVVAEITEGGVCGEALVDWVNKLRKARGESGPVGWRLMPCGCLIVEPLHDAIGNFSAREKLHA